MILGSTELTPPHKLPITPTLIASFLPASLSMTLFSTSKQTFYPWHVLMVRFATLELNCCAAEGNSGFTQRETAPGKQRETHGMPVLQEQGSFVTNEHTEPVDRAADTRTPFTSLRQAQRTATRSCGTEMSSPH